MPTKLSKESSQAIVASSAYKAGYNIAKTLRKAGWWGLALIILGFIFLFYFFRLQLSNPETKNATPQEVYGAGYMLGERLAKEQGYYNGDSYIENKCTTFSLNTLVIYLPVY